MEGAWINHEETVQDIHAWGKGIWMWWAVLGGHLRDLEKLSRDVNCDSAAPTNEGVDIQCLDVTMAQWPNRRPCHVRMGLQHHCTPKPAEFHRGTLAALFSALATATVAPEGLGLPGSLLPMHLPASNTCWIRIPSTAPRVPGTSPEDTVTALWTEADMAWIPREGTGQEDAHVQTQARVCGTASVRRVEHNDRLIRIS